MSEYTEPLTGPSMPPSSIPKLPIEQIKASHLMLTGFREGIREGTYQGKHLIHIAQGLMFLDQMIGQSQGQLEMAKKEQKEMMNRAKEEIKEAGGKLEGAHVGPSDSAA